MARTIETGEYSRRHTVDDVCAMRTKGTGELVRPVWVVREDGSKILFSACNATEEAEIRAAAAGPHFGWYLATT